MATYKFRAAGTLAGVKTQIEFEFNDDRLVFCTVDGIRMDGELATDLLGLDQVFGPGYVPRGESGSRLNAVNFLRWYAFDREPKIIGDPGKFEVEEPEEGVVY